MAEKKEAAGKATPRKKVSKGESYSCDVCGLVVTVDEVCGCIEACDIVCCGKPMKEKTAKSKAAKK